MIVVAVQERSRQLAARQPYLTPLFLRVDLSSMVATTEVPTASDIEELKARFPVAWPIPTPVTQSDMLAPSDLHREEDLLRNPHSFRHWWTAIQTARDSTLTELKASTPDGKEDPLLGPLASAVVRASFQRGVYMYEAALQVFPSSFKLWKAYLTFRSLYVLGRAVKAKRAGGRKKFQPMKDELEAEFDDLERYDGGIDGIIGWDEWKSLVATFERALMHLPNVRFTRSKTCYAPTELFFSRCRAFGCSTSTFSSTRNARQRFLSPMPGGRLIVHCAPSRLRCTPAFGRAIFFGQRRKAGL